MNCGGLGLNTSENIIRKWMEHTWEPFLWGNKKLNSLFTYFHSLLVEGGSRSAGSQHCWSAPVFPASRNIAKLSPKAGQCSQAEPQESTKSVWELPVGDIQGGWRDMGGASSGLPLSLETGNSFKSPFLFTLNKHNHIKHQKWRVI